MNTKYDLTIVGAGILGCVLALIYIRKFPNSKLLILDKARVGNSGATSVSRGIIRAFDFEEKLIDYNLEGISFYRKNFKYPLIKSSGLFYRINSNHIDYATRITKKYSSENHPIKVERFSNLCINFLNWNSDDYVIYEPYGGYGDPKGICEFIKTNFLKLENIKIIENTEVLSVDNDNVICHNKLFKTNKVVLTVGSGITRFPINQKIYIKEISVGKLSYSNTLIESTIIDGIENSYFRPELNSIMTSGSKLNSTFENISNLSNVSNQDQLQDSLNRAKTSFKNATFDIHSNQNFTREFDGYSSDSLPIIERKENIIYAYGLSGIGFKSAPSIANKIINLMD